MRTAFDAVNVANLPATSPPNFYFAYINGKNTSGNFLAVRARFPQSDVQPITVDGSMKVAALIDVENGDYTPATGAACAKFTLRQGLKPTLYSNVSTKPALDAAIAPLGMKWGDHVDWAASTLDGTKDVPGASLVQWTDHGGTYDEWVVSDGWEPLRPISHKEALDVLLFQNPAGTVALFADGKWVPILSGADANAIHAAGVGLAPVSDQLWQELNQKFNPTP